MSHPQNDHYNETIREGMIMNKITELNDPTLSQSVRLFNLMQAINRKEETLERIEGLIYSLRKSLMDLSDDVYQMHKEEYERENNAKTN